jgi:thioredoxin reductase (NADPH)
LKSISTPNRFLGTERAAGAGVPGGGRNFDVIIVGAGPAGLTCALYLARFRRSTLVVHDGTSRAHKIPLTHNVPGFDGGVTGNDLIDRMTIHAVRYGASVAMGKIVELARMPDGFTVVDDEGKAHHARVVVLATGMKTDALDLPPETLERAIDAGVLRYCPICDGYEHLGQRIAVLGDVDRAAGEAVFMRTYASDVTLIATGRAVPDAVAAELEAKGIKLVCGQLEGVRPSGGGIAVQMVGMAEALTFDVLYPARGIRPRTSLAARLGLLPPETDGTLDARAPFGTNVPGLYAVGDIVEGLDQISVAMGHGAIAATRAHNWLREQDGWVLEAQDSLTHAAPQK